MFDLGHSFIASRAQSERARCRRRRPAPQPAIAEIAVAGLPDERLGQCVTAFVKRTAAVAADALDAWCRSSPLAGYKRPRAWVFVSEIPKSPVGKILRRKLVAGEYEKDGR